MSARWTGGANTSPHCRNYTTRNLAPGDRNMRFHTDHGARQVMWSQSCDRSCVNTFPHYLRNLGKGGRFLVCYFVTMVKWWTILNEVIYWSFACSETQCCEIYKRVVETKMVVVGQNCLLALQKKSLTGSSGFMCQSYLMCDLPHSHLTCSSNASPLVKFKLLNKRSYIKLQICKTINNI